jgi:hypothetical protein
VSVMRLKAILHANLAINKGESLNHNFLLVIVFLYVFCMLNEYLFSIFISLEMNNINNA